MDLEKLYSENKGLLIHWAQHYAGACNGNAIVDVDDLIQAGFFGLVDASYSYDKEKGSWSTWASYHIRNHMIETLGLRSAATSYRVTDENGHSYRRLYKTASLDSPAYPSDDACDVSLADTVPDDSLPDMEERAEALDTARVVREAVAALDSPEMQRSIVEYFFKSKTFKQIADEQGETVNTIRNLCNKGLRRLRQARSIRQLSDTWIDRETRFHAHKGVTAFWSSGSSVVEDAVMWREELRGGRPLERLDMFVYEWQHSGANA